MRQLNPILMKKITLLLLLCSFGLYAQREKVKGSKIVTIEQIETGEFQEMEVSDNIEVFIIKGEKCGVELEADDNLHDAIAVNVHGNLLQISAVKDVTSAKKFSIRVTYTDGFKQLTARNEATITALADLTLDDFTLKAYDKTKVFANVKCRLFTLMADDNTKSELNIANAEQSNIVLSKNANLKALIASTNVKFDMYQKATAVVEGDVNDLRLRMDNNTSYTGKNFNAHYLDLTIEGYSVAHILATTKLALSATGKAEIFLYGDQKIEMRQFLDNATLYKKPTK